MAEQHSEPAQVFAMALRRTGRSRKRITSKARLRAPYYVNKSSLSRSDAAPRVLNFSERAPMAGLFRSRLTSRVIARGFGSPTRQRVFTSRYFCSLRRASGLESRE